MKVGVYVGSFDPVHKGHASIIDYLSKKLDKIIVIPTSSYWNKKINASLKDRINMLKFYENNNVEISSTLNNYEYTYQILDKLSEQYDDIYLVIGADNLSSFHLWKNVDEILKKYTVLVLGRNNVCMNNFIDEYTNKDRFILDNEFKMIDVSSTEIRNNIDNLDLIKDLMDEEILNYVIKNNVYKKSHN